MNRSTPPAIIKLNIVIPKNLRIPVPPIANTTRTIPEVIIAVLALLDKYDSNLCNKAAVFETAFRSSFFKFCVIVIKRGTVPMGLSTTKSAMVDLSKSPYSNSIKKLN
jgi:hypothetical protein